QVLPFWSADSAEQDRVGGLATRERFRRQRFAATVNRDAAKRELTKFEVVPECRRAVGEDRNRGVRHFGTDSVSGNYCDGFSDLCHVQLNHTGSSACATTSSL